MPAKNILKSKTLWVNAFTMTGVALGAIPPTKLTVILTTLANLALRLLTWQPVTLGPSDPR